MIVIWSIIIPQFDEHNKAIVEIDVIYSSAIRVLLCLCWVLLDIFLVFSANYAGNQISAFWNFSIGLKNDEIPESILLKQVKAASESLEASNFDISRHVLTLSGKLISLITKADNKPEEKHQET